jgi:hypothetical protein
MKNNTLILIVVILAAAVGVYFVLGKKGATKVVDALPAVNDDDEKTFKAMLSKMSQKVLNWTDNQPWILTDVADLYHNDGHGAKWDIADDYLINGQVTKTGCLYAVYAASVSGWAGPDGKEDKQLSSDLWTMFSNFKSRNILI